MMKAKTPLVFLLALLFSLSSCQLFGGSGAEGRWTRQDLELLADDLDDAIDVVVASNSSELAGNPYVLGSRALTSALRTAAQGEGEITIADAIAALEALEPSVREALIAAGREQTEADVAIAIVRIILRRIQRAAQAVSTPAG